MRDKDDKGVFVAHCSCPIEGCGSSDAGAYYEYEDGSYSFYCFSCQGSINPFDITSIAVTRKSRRKSEIVDWRKCLEQINEIKDNLINVDNKERKIPASIYDMYGCRMELEEDGETIKTIYYPTYRELEDGVKQHVGYRNRRRFTSTDREVEKNPEMLGVMKNFAGGIGDIKKGICLYGEWLFDPKQHKRIILACGEEDAHAVYKMTSMMTKFEGGYASVAPPSGENISSIKPRLEYLSSFEEIYIVPDQDEAGRKFCEELCKLLPVGKVFKVKLPDGVKDPSDLYKEGKSKEARERAAKTFWKCLWNAEKYSPAGIMSLSEGWNRYLNRGQDELIPFPDAFGCLNEKTFGGAALGEIVNIIAASSVGKTSFVKETLYNALYNTSYNIGVASLEEDIGEFIEGMLSTHMSMRLSEIPYDQRDRETEEIKFKEMIHYHPKIDQKDIDELDVNERIHFIDHQGACSGEDLLAKIDFLVNGLNCKIIVLDPVTLGVSGRDTDEDYMASEIVKRVKRYNLLWINVHHVRKNQQGSTANSEGADLSEESIKGSGAWFQVGAINLIFTRNKVHDNPIVRNTTKIKMSKCRRHGKNTGIVGYVYYNGETGRLEPGMSPEEILEGSPEESFEDH